VKRATEREEKKRERKKEREKKERREKERRDRKRRRERSETKENQRGIKRMGCGHMQGRDPRFRDRGACACKNIIYIERALSAHPSDQEPFRVELTSACLQRH
jgi:hypothetical protein